MRPVKSSNAKSAGYEPSTKRLRVLFNSGITYEYLDVTQAQDDALMAAESFGKHLNAFIKPNHDFEKMPT
jgi:hypothetical protein